MLCHRTAGRQLIHALTEPANLVQSVQIPHAHLSDGKTCGNLPKLLHPHERNRTVREGSSPKPSRDGSDVRRMYHMAHCNDLFHTDGARLVRGVRSRQVLLGIMVLELAVTKSPCDLHA